VRNVTIRINGNATTVREGTTVAAAIAVAGEAAFRGSVNRTPRGPLCGMGICGECRVTIDGHPNQRSCLLLCRDGMEVTTDA
jgi:sarcosine oxidase subunit alpha